MSDKGRFIVSYGDGPTPAWVSTVEELDAVLDEVTAEAERDKVPVAVYIYPADADDDGPLLMLGAGHTFSYLNFDNAHVAGDLDDNTVSRWWWGNQWSDKAPGRGILNETARQAAREFVRTGKRPEGVAWVND